MKARITTGTAAAALVALVTASVASGANVTVGAGSALDLRCADLTVGAMGTINSGVDLGGNLCNGGACP